jgi:hypothetical protein
VSGALGRAVEEYHVTNAVGKHEDVASAVTQEAMKSNSQEWKRAHIAMIGEGRAG